MHTRVILNWNTYRRERVNPAGFTKDSVGVWIRENDAGEEEEFHPFTYLGPVRMQLWQALARRELGPEHADEVQAEIMAAVTSPAEETP